VRQLCCHSIRNKFHVPPRCVQYAASLLLIPREKEGKGEKKRGKEREREERKRGNGAGNGVSSGGRAREREARKFLVDITRLPPVGSRKEKGRKGEKRGGGENGKTDATGSLKENTSV